MTAGNTSAFAGYQNGYRMLETSCKVGLQPEGAHYHSKTVIKFVSFETEKKQQQSVGINKLTSDLTQVEL